ncbi:MAG: hypothetical protein SFV51_18915 [Bryobacteraceae bacterium]|nr:hypothetical protein [Bryobacteraceae bacterium]
MEHASVEDPVAFREMWKMLHLLHVHGPALSRTAIRRAGLTCDPDTIGPLVDCGAVETLPASVPYEKAREYRLSKTGAGIIQNCLVANRREPGTDLRVDEPRAFVIMPFSQPWSLEVYVKMIEPAVREAGLACLRGDSIPRTGDLTANIVRELLTAGIAVAEVSVANPNVFYELGLCHAIGKDAILLKQMGATLPADLSGAHYYEYSLKHLRAGRNLLAGALRQWCADNCVAQIGRLGKI